MLTEVEYHYASFDAYGMETVTLPGTGLVLSRLGFGSSGLMARLGRSQSLRLLESAYEHGITHFDTARSYGYGEAETVIGDFLKGRRDRVTVTTKLGMMPRRRSRAIRAGKTMGRLVVKGAPMVRPLLRRSAQPLVRHGCFDPAEARTSLETSLRELGIDAVDILLLHECRPADLRTEGLLDSLKEMVSEGKLRYFGLGTDPETTAYAVRHHPEFTRVVQIGHSIVEPTLEGLRSRGRAVITHSSLRLGLPPLLELMRDERRRSRWSTALGIDCGHPRNLARLLLADAVDSNQHGVVLFSSTREDAIRSNAALIGNSELSPEQLREFSRLSRAELLANHPFS